MLSGPWQGHQELPRAGPARLGTHGSPRMTQARGKDSSLALALRSYSITAITARTKRAATAGTMALPMPRRTFARETFLVRPSASRKGTLEARGKRPD